MPDWIDFLIDFTPWIGIGAGVLCWILQDVHTRTMATSAWVPIKAQVSARYQRWTLSTDNDSSGQEGWNRCTLQYTYRLNNVDYRHRSHWAVSHDKQVDTPEPSLLAYELGDEIEVFVDPQHPYHTALHLSAQGSSRGMYWTACATLLLCTVGYASGHLLMALANEGSMFEAVRKLAAGIAKYLFYFSVCAYFFLRSKRNETENLASWVKATGRIRRSPVPSADEPTGFGVPADNPFASSLHISRLPPPQVLPAPTSYTYEWDGLPYTGTFNIRWYDPTQVDVATDFPDGQLIPILVNPDKPSESVNWIERQGHLRALTRLWGWLAVGGFVVMWFG
jgi:Protein of unknown function (DUF3592)